MLRHLKGAATLVPPPGAPPQIWVCRAALDVPLVLVATTLSPADMLQFKGGVVRRLRDRRGGTHQHTAIVARSMDIPPWWARAMPASWCAGTTGSSSMAMPACHRRPSPIILDEYRFGSVRDSWARAPGAAAPRRHRIAGQAAHRLLANVELPAGRRRGGGAGAVGVGLFAQILFMLGRSGRFPARRAKQYLAYRAAVEVCNLPVTIRTIDVGADKPLDDPTRHPPQPALGLRAIHGTWRSR